MKKEMDNESNESDNLNEGAKENHSSSDSPDTEESSSEVNNGDSDEPEVPSRARTPDLPDTDLRYDCGNAFEEFVHQPGNDNCLCVEDVSKSSKELWLIKAPHNFNIDGFNDQQVLLNAEQIMSSRNTGSRGNRKYNVMAMEMTPNNQSTPAHVVLPSRTSRKLKPGPAFKGQITITKSVAVLPVTLPPTPPAKTYELPAGLKQRYVPFGHDEPAVFLDSPPQSPATNSSSKTPSSTKRSSSQKKKKKKTDKEINDSSSASEDHRKAHKRKIKIEIKEENDSEIAVKKTKKHKHKT